MRVLIPLPANDFDPTETAVPWRLLTEAGHSITFLTPNARPAKADARMLCGQGLGPLKFLLMADATAQKVYREMEASPEFQNPQHWSSARVEDFDGLLLPGGHAQGMREYLESEVLMALTSAFFKAVKPVGAICHGVVLAARSRDEEGRSVLFQKKTTALLKSQEMLAWALTRLWLGDYYRTYPESVEDEVKRHLAHSSQFLKGPTPGKRDTLNSDQAGFVSVSGFYVSARWPGDAHRFAATFNELLAKH